MFARRSRLAPPVLLAALAACRTVAPVPPAITEAPSARAEEVERSNANAQVLLDVLGAFTPEHIGQLGFPGLDERILDLEADDGARFRARIGEAKAELLARRAREQSTFIVEDLDILVEAAQNLADESTLEERLRLPYAAIHREIWVGLQSLLNDKVPEPRRQAAVVRLRRYAGMEPGHAPVTTLLERKLTAKLADTKLAAPPRSQVEHDLARAVVLRDGIRQLFAKYPVPGHEAPLAALLAQLEAHEAFLRQEVLPRARDDFRMPEELYRFSLRKQGVDVAPDVLAAEARAAFQSTQADMNTLAAEVARARGMKATDYREVIRALKNELLDGNSLVPHYEQRVKDLEEIVRREHLITLPRRSMKFRLATPAETAQQPAPHVDPQGLFSKDGELAFVLPLGVTSAEGGGAKTLKYDDFMFEAASWTITAHEGRPGHDLQLSAMVERGISLARTLFAFNATNIEGWALYAERIVRPFLPPEGRLISLQHLLLRSARAFLDPELQLGRITLAEARRVLEEEVVASPALAEEELNRYTFEWPGQAPCYFFGYTKMLELRRAVEAKEGSTFDALRFHDAVVAQGLLPPPLLRRALLGASR